MKHRSIAKMILLSMVTLGIYRLYWFAKTRQEMMQTDSSVKIPHIIWLIMPILLVVATVAFMIWASFAANGSETMTPPQATAMALMYLSFFIVMPLIAIWLWKYSKAVELVTKEKMSFAITLLILLAVPDGIDILIVQDSFNKLAAVGPNPVQQQVHHWENQF